MRSWAILSAVATLGLAGPASACPYSDLVQSWYGRYLGRPADPVGLGVWVNQLRCGTPAAHVEATLLGSDEYYHRNGCSPHGFVAGLYADVLGRQANHDEVELWVCQLGRCGSRQALACRFLAAAQTELALRAAPPVYEPAPSYAPPPAYEPPAVFVPQPVVYRSYPSSKAHKRGYRPLPPPGISVGIRYRSGW